MPTPPIHGVPTSITAFADFFPQGPINQPTPVASFSQFLKVFGPLDTRSEAGFHIQQFFLNGGTAALILNTGAAPLSPASLAPLKQPGLFSLLCLPSTATLSATPMLAVMQAAQILCQANRAFYLADIPPSSVIATPAAIETWFSTSNLDLSSSSAVYYPRLTLPNPLAHGQPHEIGTSGTAAGIYARMDANRGISHAPAGLEATFLGGATPVFAIDDTTNGHLNTLGINAIRTFPGKGTVLWGSRTTRGADTFADEYKYVPVRRLALFIESSVITSLLWTAVEPDTETLWAAIRATVSNFLLMLFRMGSFQGAMPSQAFFVKCDASTTTQQDVFANRVNILIGFAPLRPAEFLILKITLPTG
ncbi:MAG: phage tail protein [Acidobacteriaceae bacterium]|nr:phage tail protein [Acidobacteriaceae bacterium]